MDNMITLGNYGVGVTPGTRTGEQVIETLHNQNYSFLLTNQTGKKVLATFEIDNDPAFSVIITGNSYANELTCNPNTQDKFIALASGTAEAAASGEAALTTAEKGLIKVTFQPELTQEVFRTPKGLTRGGGYESYGMRGGASKGVDFGGETTRSFGGTRSMSRGATSAVTGYSGKSDQQFRTTDFVGDPNEANWVVIQFRLTAVHPDAAQSIKPISGRRARAARLDNGFPPIV